MPQKDREAAATTPRLALKLRFGTDLNVGIEFSASVPSRLAQDLETEQAEVLSAGCAV